MRIALYQPDIAQNLGTTIRTAACLGIGIDVIEPCGFPFDDRKFRRAGMDYIDTADIVRHISWDAFLKNIDGKRLVLLSSKSSTPYTDFSFQEDDILLAGRESAGVPEEVFQSIKNRVTIPMCEGYRSLNVAVSIAMVAGEVLRQLSEKR